MQKVLDIGPFLDLAGSLPVVDVRSPGEFAQGHIPGAVNLPLFDNMERAKVGTLYRQNGREEAIHAGLEIVGPKMALMVKKAMELAVNGEVLVHCWRGGMRSESVSWLFNNSGIKASTLKNGYKAYRHQVLNGFTAPAMLLVVGGETGSGKTDILRSLKEKGEQVLDLEGIAHHKGSSFGALGEEKQPSPEQFGNDVYETWRKLDLSRPVWVEDESKSIGKVFIPDQLWEQMKVAPVLRIQVPKSKRVERLVREYGRFPKPELAAAIQRIERRLGNEAFNRALKALEEDHLSEVADITLGYYDKAYDHPHKERKYVGVNFIETSTGDPGENADRLLSFVNTHFKKKERSDDSE